MTMTNLHLGYGAARAKKVNEDIYTVLRDILKDEPKAKLSKLKRLYVDAVINDPNLNRSFIEAFFVNVYSSLIRKESSRKPRKVTNEQMRKQIGRAIFNFEMPNGKRLSECTSKEIRKFGARFSKGRKKRS